MDEKRNISNYYIRNLLFNTANIFITGTIIVTFMKSRGIDNASIGIYNALVNAVGIAIYVLLSGLADKTGKIIRYITLLTLPVCLFPISLAIQSRFGGGLSSNVQYYLILGMGLFAVAISAMRVLYEVKLPYLIIDSRDLGRVSSVNGIITGIVGAAVGGILSFTLSKFEYSGAMSIFFGAAALAFAASAIYNARFVNISGEHSEEPPEEQSHSFRSLIRLPAFYNLAVPNFLRGAAFGIFDIMALVGLNTGTLNTATTSYLVTAAMLSFILGCTLYAWLEKRVLNRYFIVVGSLLVALFPLATIRNPVVFIGAYFFIRLGLAFVDYSIYISTYKTIPFKYGGIYHTWRLNTTTAGIALSSALGSWAIGRVPVWVILAFAAASQIGCGIGYERYCRKHNV